MFSSTGGALYGEPRRLPADEDHPVLPLSPYGASKAAGETYARRIWLDVRRADHELGWRTAVPFADGVAQTVAAMREEGAGGG